MYGKYKSLRKTCNILFERNRKKINKQQTGKERPRSQDMLEILNLEETSSGTFVMNLRFEDRDEPLKKQEEVDLPRSRNHAQIQCTQTSVCSGSKRCTWTTFARIS